MGTAGFGLMLDVSEGGLGVQVMNRVEPGTDIEIAFKVPELASPIEGTGVVTWCDGDGRLGVRFKQLNNNSTDQLKQWMNSLPEAMVHEPIELPPSPSAAIVTEQVRAIKSQIAAAKLDVDLVLQFLVERVIELTHSNGGAIALGEGSNMICRASSGLAPDVGVSIGSGSALTSECLRTGKIVRCDDTETDQRVDREICRELNLRSSLILPILFEKKVRGVLEVFSPLPNAFNSHHLALLQQLSDFTAQIVYGPMPANAAAIESSAKSKSKPEHSALSALLTATTTSSEAPTPTASAPTPAPAKAPADISPKPVEKATSAAAVTSMSAAAAKPALAPAAAKEVIAKTEVVTKAAEEVVAKELVPSALDIRPREFEFTFDSPDENASRSTSLFIAVAVVLVLTVAIAGWVYYTRQQPASQPVVATVPATQSPAPPATLPAATTPATTTAAAPQTQPAPASKATPHGLVAADTVRSPNAAIVKADDSSPLVIESGSAPQRRPDAPPAVAPSITVSSNMGAITLPNDTSRPELAPQGIVTGGNLLRRVEPVYPAFAQQHRIQGDVVLTARVTRNGTLDRIKRVKGNPVFEPACLAAVRQWRYEPYKLNGQPQDVDVSITLQFKLKP